MTYDTIMGEIELRIGRVPWRKPWSVELPKGRAATTGYRRWSGSTGAETKLRRPSKITFRFNEACEQIIRGYPNRPKIESVEQEVYYSRLDDRINLPMRERFNTLENYYLTLFHELIHSTGHDSRLSRLGIIEKPPYGSEPYAHEERIAELGAAFLCVHSGIAEKTINNVAGYLNCWLDHRLGTEFSVKLLTRARFRAEAAVAYILQNRAMKAR